MHGHSLGGWWERVSGRPETGTCSSLDQVLRTRAAASLHSR
ncbi:hypothetical protein MA4S0726RB_4726 [Mycobacteroides abscessus 4S-0726-RB]|nr:hypothetical protein MA4S0726RB_4726 [Mycobacteroides abscessus 4S-0726-RB]EIU00919.1 hypothetical protein MA4S0726RA_0232 [Mycobacteroides abscessus 4S-0726-RA]EIU03161.1 hypothetical protein MA4S0303_0507 [Mycobacteroides abscessus 4S-0303]EIV08217.1 hypothetical protein MA4S0206_1958 [Mycobacteroides abscessus 4S-0206]EIV52516.1 hypothetical protein MA4S0116R_0499 [Mycobacteroides abscessus 4S-0116-R]EIV61355.1 hypothetical protein MA4S0116S_4267 [Mycobacteroides abscessus 4S-0116-S]